MSNKGHEMYLRKGGGYKFKVFQTYHRCPDKEETGEMAASHIFCLIFILKNIECMFGHMICSVSLPERFF